MPTHVEFSKQRDFLQKFIKKMEAEGQPLPVIDIFSKYYNQMGSGEKGLIYEKDIQPLTRDEIPYVDRLECFKEKGEKLLNQTAMIKLNGGLGTSMGLKIPKSLLKVFKGKRFLDIILKQAASLNVDLVFMNSFNTHDECTQVLESVPAEDRPLCFMQHKFPKILQRDLSPATWPENPTLEWNPAGHGDIYMSLVVSGMLDELLNRGIKYAFISNSDNLGATIDPTLLGYFSAMRLAFMVEVAERTDIDQKGGHLAKSATGKWVLREIAQCPAEDMNAFTDIRRHQNFNTNNIWIQLEYLKEMATPETLARLPFITNPKHLDPLDDSTPPVYQIEMAMGHAISLFDNVGAVKVPRNRFFPVKKTSDMMILRSDLMQMLQDGRLESRSANERPFPVIKLDPQFYKNMDDFNDRMRKIPSLHSCSSLEIKGDIRFESEVVLQGDVSISNISASQAVIREGMRLSGKVFYLKGIG